MSKKVFSVSLSIFTTLALISCSQVTPNISTSNNSDSPIPESVNTDTTLKIESVIPKMFGTKANKLKSGDLIPGRFIIMFKNNEKTDLDNENLIKSAHAKKLGDIKKSMRMYLIEADDVLNNNVLETLKDNPDVVFIEQDRIKNVDETQNQIQGTVLQPKKVSNNSTSTQSVDIAADTRPVANFVISGNGYIINYNAHVGDVVTFPFNTNLYIVKSDCLEGLALPAGFTSTRPLCANAQAPVQTSVTFSYPFQGNQNFIYNITYTTYIGAIIVVPINNIDYIYEIKSNCIQGPALPQGATANPSLCTTTPVPTPTATIVPTPVVTPTPISSGRPGGLPLPGGTPIITPTPVSSGRPGGLPLPGGAPTATPTPISSGRPGGLPLPGGTPIITPTPVSSGRPGGLPTPIGTSTPVATPVPTATPNLLPFTVNDPLRNSQYIISKIKLLEGLAISAGSSDVTIAIIDTGVEATHEDLSGKIVSGFTDFSGSSEMTDPHGHGTHCAGIAAAKANNGIGIVGVAPNAKIMPIQVLGPGGQGSDATVAAGIMYAADSSAKVLSMSLGGAGESAAITAAVKHAVDNGKVMIAAMGNGALTGNITSYPAANTGVIAVGSTDNADQRSTFSQYGSHILVSAPGSDIYSTVRGNTYTYFSGTSMSTPAVAGLAALILGYKPQYTPSQVKIAIQNGTDDLGTPGFDNYFGYGRINVQKTLSRL